VDALSTSGGSPQTIERWAAKFSDLALLRPTHSTLFVKALLSMPPFSSKQQLPSVARTKTALKFFHTTILPSKQFNAETIYPLLQALLKLSRSRQLFLGDHLTSSKVFFVFTPPPSESIVLFQPFKYSFKIEFHKFRFCTVTFIRSHDTIYINTKLSYSSIMSKFG
jgi:hypothetical protein